MRDKENLCRLQNMTIGSLSGKAGEKAKEDFKINGQYIDKPDESVTLHGVEYPDGVVGIPFFGGYVEKAAIEFLEQAAKYPPRPLQSETYTGPITLSQYFRLQSVRERLEKEGISLPLPTGN